MFLSPLTVVQVFGIGWKQLLCVCSGDCPLQMNKKDDSYISSQPRTFANTQLSLHLIKCPNYYAACCFAHWLAFGLLKLIHCCPLLPPALTCQIMNSHETLCNADSSKSHFPTSFPQIPVYGQFTSGANNSRFYVEITIINFIHKHYLTVYYIIL